MSKRTTYITRNGRLWTQDEWEKHLKNERFSDAIKNIDSRRFYDDDSVNKEIIEYVKKRLVTKHNHTKEAKRNKNGWFKVKFTRNSIGSTTWYSVEQRDGKFWYRNKKRFPTKKLAIAAIRKILEKSPQSCLRVCKTTEDRSIAE